MKFLLLFFVIFFSNRPLFAADCESQSKIREYKPSYAKLFSINYYANFKIIISGNDKFIVGDKTKINCTTKLPIINSNVSKLVATSTTHLAFLKTFSLEKILIAFPNIKYIYNPIIRGQKVKDINYQLNAEELLALKPDLIMAYSANLSSEHEFLKLRKLGLPIVLNHDFKEKNPLARAEWQIFTSLFVGKDLEAQKLFTEIVENYNKLKSQVHDNQLRPIVLVGDIQNGKWVTCGGESDLGILIKDAGGQLLLESPNSETQYISLEKALSTPNKPMFWFTQNMWNDSKAAVKDSRYKSFLNTKKYNNNKKVNAEGFNDFWETGTSRPDLILQDLYSIIHLEKDHNSQLIWYKELP
jgi:iron complex transport system substrate-binding protein